MACGKRTFPFRAIIILGLVAGCAFAQSSAIEPTARASINAGNQAWVTGMKSGDAGVIAATYTDEALDCGVGGQCEKGRTAIYAHLKGRVAKLGRAASASVTTTGSVQQGDFVYEWGSAKASFAGDHKIEGLYLTVWQKQPDGSWKIFRNISIPADR